MSEVSTQWFLSGGVKCEAWHLAAESTALTGPAGRPAVVMAHGLAGTKDSGLLPFARALAAAGSDVLLFDFRGFGGSEGDVRQRVRVADQLADYEAALDHASGLPGVDPGRLVAWGVSLSGGHVFEIAARRPLAAVISLVPLVSGPAAGRLALKHHAPSRIALSTAAGIRGRVTELAGGAQVMMPVVAEPGEPGAFTVPGAKESYLRIAGPSWRNEVDATVTLELGSYRPGRLAKQVGERGCPFLVQIADFDRSAPPQSAAKAAFKARAQVRHYPGDHFDVMPGGPCHDAVVAHQISFLRHQLATGA